ncbi:MAG: hypothetical protein K2M65_03915 [Muribaculaceae bacterium]|nr:hypothetical protein [Muribaculaceae bacterium]
MKYRNALLAFVLVLAQTIWANTNTFRPGGTQLEKYTIVYQADADANEGVDRAIALQGMLEELTGVQNTVKTAGEVKKGPVISIVKLPEGGTFDYSVNVRNGKVTIAGGGSWAMNKGAEAFIDYIKNNPKAKSFQLEGTVEGEVLFARPEGVNLRILDDNVWQYSLDTIPPAWQQAGLDCRDSVRVPQFVQIVRAYMPDVLVLQEYCEIMNNMFFPQIKKFGYRNACKKNKKGDWNNTPVFYNSDSLKLLHVNYNLYTPEMWSNHGSKSFTSAVFRQKSTGKVFAIINTHLWWKGDHVKPGSTYARAAQVNLMLAEAEIIKSKYDCPIFITGDMNCEEKSMPMQVFINSGCVPCYKAATVYGNRDNGHHVCGPTGAGIRKSNRKGPDRETGAIDHCFIMNSKDAEIKVFDCLQEYFMVLLTDHYPNLIEVAL